MISPSCYATAVIPVQTHFSVQTIVMPYGDPIVMVIQIANCASLAGERMG